MALINVVSWNSTPDIFAYKYPENNLTTFTQLLVHQTQEAALFHKGKLVSKFGPGKHTLSTENIPLLHELFGIPFGGENPFTAEVWFINKVFVLDVKWGTATPFNIRDPYYEVMIPVRANGQFGIQIQDMEQFLVKLVGMLPVFDKENLSQYLKGVLMAEATGIIAKKMVDDKISILDIAAHIIPISQQLKEVIGIELKEYGIGLLNFYVNSISVPEEDQAVKHLKSLLSKRAEMSVLGYTYQQERSFDVLDTAANNQGQMGGIMGVGMGLGMGFGVGGTMGEMAKNMAPNVQNNTKPCHKCGFGVDVNSKFCPSCGVAAMVGGVANYTTSTSICNKCQGEIPESAKFCPNCGDVYNKCPNCSVDIPEGNTQCPQCKYQLPIKCDVCKTTMEPSVSFCPTCGKSMKKTCNKCGLPALDSDSAFCTKCGNKLE